MNLRYLTFMLLIGGTIVSCRTTQQNTQDTNSGTSTSKRKKDPVAAAVAVKIGNMLDQLAQELKGATNQNAEIIRTAEGVNITFQPDFYFDSSLDELNETAKEVVGRVSDVLNRYPYTEIFIEGHADSSGNQMNNKLLSERRAKNVALFMKSKGVKADRMAVAGYGATRPVASNATPEGRKLNRRVLVKIRANEMKFIEADGALPPAATSPATIKKE